MNWTPQGQWATDRGIAECVELEDFGIIGAWIDRTGEGYHTVQQICHRVSCHEHLVTGLRELELRTRQFIAGELVSFPAALLPQIRALIEHAENA